MSTINIMEEASKQRREKASAARLRRATEIEDSRKRALEDKAWFDGAVLALRPALMSMHDQAGYRVRELKTEAEGRGDYGEAFQIFTDGEGLLGHVCIGYRYYMFRGSDESPEQECREQCIWFTRVPYLKDTVNFFQRDTVDEFIKAMIDFVATHE